MQPDGVGGNLRPTTFCILGFRIAVTVAGIIFDAASLRFC